MSTRYTVIYAPRAQRDLRKLPEKIATACVEFIGAILAEAPYQAGKPLTASWEGLLLGATVRVADHPPH